MSKPLDDDFNYDIKPSTPREARGGAFAPADMPLIKEALYALIEKIDKDDNRVTKIASLLHRIGRVS